MSAHEPFLSPELAIHSYLLWKGLECECSLWLAKLERIDGHISGSNPAPGTPSRRSASAGGCRAHRATAGWEHLNGGCTSPRVTTFVVSWGDTSYCVPEVGEAKQCWEQHTWRCTQTSDAAWLVMGKNGGGVGKLE